MPPANPSSLQPVARRRSTRDRPAKSPLSEDAIVDVALTILTSDGLAAVTMRSVAAALDTGPASLYVWVEGREGLLQAMLGRVVASVGLEEPDPSRWRDQLQSLLRRLHEALVAHPGIATMTLVDPPTTEPVLRLTENLLGTLLAGGLNPQDAAWTCDIFIALVTNAAREDVVRRPRGALNDGRKQVGEIRRTFADLPPDWFPHLTTYAVEMVAGYSDERLHYAIDVVIDGVLARAVQR
jgi:AcrR family transcriptional regulator